MCKLMCITKTDQIEAHDLEQLTKFVAGHMGKTEKDGFGITILKNDNSLYARRFLNPDNASMYNMILNKSFIVKNVNDTGKPLEKDETVKSIIFHGRMSTNNISLVNTHPIVKHDIWLSHNGVVEDSGPKYKMNTSNDTEHMVERLSQGISAIEKNITGYYATMSFKDDQKGQLTIIKDDIANLSCAFIEDIDSYVFATTEKLISDVCESMGWTHSVISNVKDNVMLVFDGNELVSSLTFKPKGQSKYANSLKYLSLGDDYKSDSSYLDYGINPDSQLEYNIESFLNETEHCGDDTWTFILHNRSINFKEFLKLKDNDRLNCFIIRADGTICSWDEKENNKLYDGQAI